MCDSNYVSLRNYNNMKKESFEIKSGFIELSKITENSVSFVTVSSTTLKSWGRSVEDVEARAKAIAADKADRALGIKKAPVPIPMFYKSIDSTGNKVITKNRIYVALDIPAKTELLSVEVFTKDINGFWVTNPQALNQQKIAYDSTTQTLYLGGLNDEIFTGVFRPASMDGPVVRIIVTW